jgi:hypothetical protein
MAMLCVIGMAIQTAGYSQAGHPAPNFFAAQEKADFFALQKMAKNHKSLVLNLADPVQYRYVVNSLKRTGITEENSPQLFKSLRETGMHQQPGPPMAEAAFGRDSGGIGPLNLFDQLCLLDPATNKYQGSVYSSYPDGTLMTRVLMNLSYVTNQGDTVVFADTSSNAQWAKGEAFRVFLGGNLPSNAAPGSNVLGHAVVLVKGGGRTGQGAAAAGGIEAHFVNAEDRVPSSIGCMTAPNYTLNQGAPTTCPPVTAPCVNKGLVVNPIEVCYSRNNGSCSYGYNTGPYPTTLIFPISGYAVFPSAIKTPLDSDNLDLTLQLYDGGGCHMDTTATGTQITRLFTVSGDTLKWCLIPASFPKNGCLNTPMAIVNMEMDMFVLLQNGQYGSCNLTSDSNAYHGQPGFYKIPQIQIFQGCVAGNTRVMLGYGKELEIRKFKGDGMEEVLSAGSGIAGGKGGATEHRKVTGTTIGREYDPMVFIRGASGDTLLVTMRHPILVPGGVKLAGQLKKGDTVFTLQGTTILTEVSRKHYADTVWNLRTGTMAEAATQATTFFANNFLIGDIQMQQIDWIRERNRVAGDAEVLKRLPPEWRQDYLNDLHRKQGK